MIKSRIVVACDSFKGACTSLEAGNAVLRGILKRLPDAEVTVLSVGDGGEGTAFALGSSLGFKKQHFCVSDTHGEPVLAEFYSSNDNATAIFDMASCSGIVLAKSHGLDILHASTTGVGQMIRHLAELGAREVIVCLGGSGTSDGGVGALSELGVRFFDCRGELINERLCPENLRLIHSAALAPAMKLLDGIKLTLLYDSSVKLLGECGAVMMYSRQKGASEDMLPSLEADMAQFSRVFTTPTADFSEVSGSGAAGGLGFGLSVVGGKLTPGADFVLDRLGFSDLLPTSTLVITGEGKTDRQSSTGKLPSAVAKRAAEFGVPVICLCGMNEAGEDVYDCGITSVIQIVDGPMSLEESMERTLPLLEKCAYDIAGLIPYIN